MKANPAIHRTPLFSAVALALGAITAGTLTLIALTLVAPRAFGVDRPAKGSAKAAAKPAASAHTTSASKTTKKESHTARPPLGPGEETVTFGSFGTVTLYHRTPHPSRVVLFVSGDGGWNLGVVDMARELEPLDALVIGIDITHYLKELVAAPSKCAYPASDFEELSKFVQEKLGYPTYQTPVLVGYSSGATLVYAILVQAPSNTFRGALSLGFCPDLDVSKPFCPGNGLRWRPGAKGKGVIFLPATTLEVPFVALQGTIDQICFPESTVTFINRTKNARVIVLQKVGHGYSVPKNWMPQFKEAFESIMQSAPVDAPMVRSDELQDLPLIEVPARGATSREASTGASTGAEAGATPQPDSASSAPGQRDAIVIEVTGDGGWSVTDKGLANTLSAEGFPVVGLNSLHYFWHEKTPDEASKDLSRLIDHYLPLWKKEKVILIGYSFGAEVVPFMYNRLPAAQKAKVSLMALLAPSPHADFRFHVVDWIGGNGSGDRYPVVPEIAKIAGPKILCFYGSGEGESACTQCDPAKVTSIQYGGGHRIGGRYDELARRILDEAR
jgi:type IV secretory pathway VirJ component